MYLCYCPLLMGDGRGQERGLEMEDGEVGGGGTAGPFGTLNIMT